MENVTIDLMDRLSIVRGDAVCPSTHLNTLVQRTDGRSERTIELQAQEVDRGKFRHHVSSSKLRNLSTDDRSCHTHTHTTFFRRRNHNFFQAAWKLTVRPLLKKEAHNKQPKMVLMNYHEMTMNEPRDSPARRQQFLVICSVMAAAFVYTAMTSGFFLSVQATEGPFPGGNYCYKFAVRDYAASNGQSRRISEDWALATTPSEEKDDFVKLQGEEKDEFKRRKKQLEGKIYHVFLDDPFHMGGSRQRYMSGVLVSDADKAEYCEPLMALNPKIEKTIAKNKKIAFEDKSTAEIFQETPYEHVNLPSVNSLVVQFPFTNGFVSALIFSYKVCLTIA
jgi:hypothetical protein